MSRHWTPDNQKRHAAVCYALKETERYLMVHLVYLNKKKVENADQIELVKKLLNHTQEALYQEVALWEHYNLPKILK